MSEYNIQMNKYNALNAEYDQLYPQPMKHANTHAKDGSDPITPSSIGAAELGEDGKVLASQVDAYSKEESISAETRTALSLAETATPDDALAEIARQLSESGGFQMDLLWPNASPKSSFEGQDIVFDTTKYNKFAVEYLCDAASDYCKFDILPSKNTSYIISFLLGSASYDSGTLWASFRSIKITDTGATIGAGRQSIGGGNISAYNVGCIPQKIYGIKT